MKLLYTIVFSAVLSLGMANMVQLQKSILDKILRGYDSNMRPNTIGSIDLPTQIKVNLFISDIFEVNDIKMEYTVQMYLREIWMDPRLRFPDPEGIVQTIPVNNIQRVWTPDLFFNEREGKFHHVQRANRFIRIYSSGKVTFNSRLTLKLHCPMDFKYFPFDRQICSFELESYGYETKDITLAWTEGNPIQVNSKLHMTNFILEDFVPGFCGKPTKDGYGCLEVKLQMKRQYGFYLTEIFIPFVILVAVSWLSLWLDARAMTLRLSLIVILLFMMSMLTVNVRTVLPSVSYSKAIDIWIAVCMALVFATLLQFILVNQLSRREAAKHRIIDHNVIINGTCERRETRKNSIVMDVLEKCSSHHIPLSKRIDFLCRVLFPVAFVIFNCIFWLTYIKGRDSRLIIR